MWCLMKPVALNHNFALFYYSYLYIILHEMSGLPRSTHNRAIADPFVETKWVHASRTSKCKMLTFSQWIRLCS